MAAEGGRPATTIMPQLRTSPPSPAGTRHAWSTPSPQLTTVHADGGRASAVEQAEEGRRLAAEGAPPQRARRSARPAQRVPALLHGRVHIGAQADAALPRRRRRLDGVGRHRQLLRSNTGGSRMRMQCDHGCESEMRHSGAANGDCPAFPPPPAPANLCDPCENRCTAAVDDFASR